MSEYILKVPDYVPPFDPAVRAVSLGEEIVRCRDCYYRADSPAWPGANECDYINRGVEPDGFCAWGERRDA